MIEAVRNIAREGGLSAFFVGNATGLISQPITIALSFFFFERFRVLFSQMLAAKATAAGNQLATFMAGGLAQAAAVVLAYPLRMAKDKLQGAAEGTYTGMLHVWREAYCKGGVFANGGVYGGCVQDAGGNFAKKGLTFWSRDLFVSAFAALLQLRSM